VFATSRNVADRLLRFNGVDAELLPHPPQTLAYRTADSEGFVLSVNRLDRAKRIDLLIEAAKAEPSLRVVIAGDGPDRERLEQLASGLNGQVEFAGRVDDERPAVSPSTTRPSTRTSAWSRTRRSSRRNRC
jgi:glycosyltransferase involved in cell wall biosynthesis